MYSINSVKITQNILNLSSLNSRTLTKLINFSSSSKYSKTNKCRHTVYLTN